MARKPKLDGKGRQVDDDGKPLGGAVQQTDPALQKAADVLNAAGYLGTRVDPTPDEHYTVTGVLAGKPTPETDPDRAVKTHEAKGV